jgi:hypothetical protein
MKKNYISIEEALNTSEVVTDCNYCGWKGYDVRDDQGTAEDDFVRVIIMTTPDNAEITESLYNSSVVVMELDVDSTIGRSKYQVSAGTVVALVSDKAPRKYTDISLTFELLKCYAKHNYARFGYLGRINIEAVIAAYMMVTLGFTKSEIMRAMKISHRKSEKECNAFMKAVVRNTRTTEAKQRANNRRKAGGQMFKGFKEFVDKMLGELRSNTTRMADEFMEAYQQFDDEPDVVEINFDDIEVNPA